MSECNIAALPDRALLRVSGAGARAFLQGMITNDIGKAEGGSAIHTGLLSPQGKILFDFFVLPDQDGYLLDVARDQREALRQRLTFYRLRAEVKFEDEGGFEVAAAWGAAEPRDVPPGALLFADPRLPRMGYRLIVPTGTPLSALGCAAVDAGAYHAHRIAEGVPEGGRDFVFGDSFPHDALFDQLNGVDFKKGCFVGQEVVARMQHRGTARKRVVGVEAEAALPASGTEVLAGDSPLGTLGSVSGKSGLALLRLDRAEDAKAKSLPLRVGDTEISLRIPEWARFEPRAAAAS